MENLEEKTKKLNWKEAVKIYGLQFVPIWGIYQIYKDARKGRPVILDYPRLSLWSGAYHGDFAMTFIGELYKYAKEMF